VHHRAFAVTDPTSLNLSKSEQDLTMTEIASNNTNLHWDVLTVKRPGLTRELPPGKEELMWVANSSTHFSDD
jgi:hypothetical protein